MNYSGKKVICIDASMPNERVPKDYKYWLVKDEEYTIDSTRMDLNGEVGVTLKELSNPPVYIEVLGGKVIPGFNIKRFRFVDELAVSQEEHLELQA